MFGKAAIKHTIQTMCGIWAFLGHPEGRAADFKQCVEALSPRGPEYLAIASITSTMVLGFTRLAINGLSPAGNQPLENDGIYVICNGEIYNFKTLAVRWGIAYDENDSDCVVLGPLYAALANNMVSLCRTLDGVFSMILVDTRRERVFIARDPYGVRPLFEGRLAAGYMWSSELKGLHTACTNVRPFPPGTWQCHDLNTGKLMASKRYHDIPSVSISVLDDDIAKHCLRSSLIRAVRKRLLSDRPIGALLSGGVDSSLVASIVAREIAPQKLQTFSIGFEGSPDLKYARMVADKIGSDHHEIVVTPDDFRSAVPDVIQAIESYDITTVRASVGNWLIGKYIKEHSDCKVIFNGDGSDEIGGGYKYMRAAPSDEEFEFETERLLSEIHLFDVLRSDRCMAAHGLEARTPFLDKQVVATWKSAPVELRRPSKTRIEKSLLRDAFVYDNYLPGEVLWRKKEAFSDGISAADSEPWYARPDEAEYYLALFSEYYKPWASVIPHMWMPRWVNAADPSARALLLQ
jgi:asparagine synthase (glutamine-hydrolysing)